MTTDARPEQGPGHAAALRGRNAIEEALLLLPQIDASIDRASLRDHLLRAIHAAYLAIDTSVLSVAHVEALGQAAAGCDECRVILDRARAAEPSPGIERAVDWLGQAHRALREGYEAVARIQFIRRSELHAGTGKAALPQWRPFRASVGVPSLHAMARAPLLPHVFVEPAAARSPVPPTAAIERPHPDTLEELSAFAEAAASGAIDEQIAEATAEPPPSPVAPPPEKWAYEPAVEEADVLRRLARDCLEEIASHRMLRKPNVMETWLDQGPFEQRILDNLDAFTALGGAVLPQIALYQADAKSPDPERAFAMALILGSIEGGDVVAAAVMAFKQSAPETYPGWLEGFWLAPNPEIDAAMADLATSDRPAWVAFAFDVMHHRGSTPAELVRRHASSVDTALLTRVARALATSLPRDEAVVLLLRLMETPGAEEVRLEAVRSLLVRGHAPVLASLRAMAAGDPKSEPARRALWMLSLAGSPADLDLLLRGVEVPTPALVRGLGRFGHAGALPRLLELLSNEDAEVAESAAEALDRITGAGLREIIEEPWEVDIPKELLEEGLAVPMRKRQRVSTDVTAWSSWLAKPPSKLDPRQRLRAGAPLSPVHIVAELESQHTPAPRRDEAAEELTLLLGHRGPFSTSDWVLRQRELLHDLRGRATTSAAPPGAWGFGWDATRTSSPASPQPVVPPLPPLSLPEASPAAPRARELPSFMQAPAAASPAVPRPDPAPVPQPSISKPAGADPRAAGASPVEDMSTLEAQPSPLAGSVLPFSPSRPPTHGANQPPAGSPDTASLPFVSAPAPSRDSGSEAAGRKPRRPGEALDDATRESVPSPVKAVLPFQHKAQPGRAGAPPAGAAVELTLDQYASMCAELAVFRERAEAVFAKYGLTDPRRRAAVDAMWKDRLSKYPSERAEWERRYWQYESSWRRSRR